MTKYVFYRNNRYAGLDKVPTTRTFAKSVAELALLLLLKLWCEFAKPAHGSYHNPPLRFG